MASRAWPVTNTNGTLFWASASATGWLLSPFKFMSSTATSKAFEAITLYNWKAKYGGLEVSEAKRLRALEDENGRLKRLLADAMLDNAGLKDLLSKKW